MSAPPGISWRRWTPATLSRSSGLRLSASGLIFVAADGEPDLLFVAPLAAAPGVVQALLRTRVPWLYSIAFFCLLALFVFCVVSFIILAAFAFFLAPPTLCLGCAWQLTRNGRPRPENVEYADEWPQPLAGCARPMGTPRRLRVVLIGGSGFPGRRHHGVTRICTARHWVRQVVSPVQSDPFCLRGDV